MHGSIRGAGELHDCAKPLENVGGGETPAAAAPLGSKLFLEVVASGFVLLSKHLWV